MGLTPEEIERREFASTLRGYDRDEVRAFLKQVGRTVRDLQDQVTEAQTRVTEAADAAAPLAAAAMSSDIEPDRFGAIGERVAELLRLGHDSAAELRANAESESQSLLDNARDEADRMTSEAEATLLSARTQADTMVADARSEAENLLAESRLEAETLLSSAEAQAETLRTTAQSDAETLRATAGSEAETLLAEAEAEAAEVRQRAGDVLTDSQVKADELWANAEAEAYKLREDGRLEAEQIREAAQSDAGNLRQTADQEVAALRAQVDSELTELRTTTEADCDRMLTEAQSEATSLQEEAERVLSSHRSEAAELKEAAEAEAEATRSLATEDAERIRTEGQSEADRMRTDADTFVETRRDEGERLYDDRQREAEEYVAARHQEADDYVAARQGEVYKNAAEAEAERDRALAGIADAREQVKQLLEQARAQSEFIRQEAEDVIRAKVRANIDQAERRIARLRITEQASRERIIAAQNELQSAISRLDAEPMDELGDGTDDLVIAEAEQRVLSTGLAQPQAERELTGQQQASRFSTGPQAVVEAREHELPRPVEQDPHGRPPAVPFPRGEEAPLSTTGPAEPVDPTFDDDAAADGTSEMADPDAGPGTDRADAERRTRPAGSTPRAAGAFGRPPSDFDELDDFGDETIDHPAGGFPDQIEIREVHEIRELRGAGDGPIALDDEQGSASSGKADGTADDDVIDLEVEAQVASGRPGGVANGDDGDAVEQVLSEPPIEPQDEDALSRLVREAMQRAVESARGSEQR